MNPKTEPAFPSKREFQIPGKANTMVSSPGLSQYAEIAARFHAALIPMHLHSSGEGPYVATLAFNQADHFFAELAKRTK